MNATEAIIEVLEDNLLPFTPNEVAIAAQELGIGGNIKVLSREVLEEGVRRAMEAVRGLRETFGELPYPESTLEEHLRAGGGVAVEFSESGLPSYRLVWGGGQRRGIGYKKGYLLLMGGEFSVPTREGEFCGNFYFNAWPGVPRVHLGKLHATRGRVFFREGEGGLEKALKNVRALGPLFASLGLSDLEGAMEALAKLKDGEAWTEGPYVLARDGDAYALRRGSVLGDPSLDGAVLLGREVRLSFPGDVEIAFRTRWTPDDAVLDWAHVRLGEEEVFLHGRSTSVTPIHGNPLVSEMRRALVRELEGREGEFSPRTLAFLKAFARHEDPFGALAEGTFPLHVKAEFFLGL
jgi:hypothetical protein